MKPVHEWNESDLLSLPLGEYDWLEVKERRSIDFGLPNIDRNKVREMLAKELSALANSGGGVLVLGMLDPGRAQTWVVDNGGVPLVVSGLDIKEWLEDIIPNLMDLPLRDFNVHLVRSGLPDSQIHEDKAVIVIGVKDSSFAPHQCVTDQKYYGRIGGKSKPLGHRFVLDILGRQQHPKLTPEVWIREETKRFRSSGGHLASLAFGYGQPVGEEVEVTEATLYFRVENVGRVYANFVVCELEIPYLASHLSENPHIYDVPPGDLSHAKVTEEFENTKRDYVGSTQAGITSVPNYGPARFVPILPTRGRSWSHKLVDNWRGILDSDPVPEIRWTIFVDNAPSDGGSIPLSKVEIESVEPDNAGEDERDPFEP